MKDTLVSIVIAVKNGERFLASAINSVLEQDYQPYEIIVVDDQSVDRTAEIARSFKEVRYNYLPVNQGVAAARNVGIDAAKGEFLTFLSHDNLLTPNKLSVQVPYMIEHPNVQYTIARVKYFLEPECPVPSGFRKELLENDHVGLLVESMLARKSLFDFIGKFNALLPLAEDVDWFARANDNDIPMAIMPQVLLHIRIHDRNLTNNVALNNQKLLQVLRESIERKRTVKSGNDG